MDDLRRDFYNAIEAVRHEGLQQEVQAMNRMLNHADDCRDEIKQLRQMLDQLQNVNEANVALHEKLKKSELKCNHAEDKVRELMNDLAIVNRSLGLTAPCKCGRNKVDGLCPVCDL